MVNKQTKLAKLSVLKPSQIQISHDVNLIHERPVATGWLHTICVIKFATCKGKVSNLINIIFYLSYLLLFFYILTTKINNTKC